MGWSGGGGGGTSEDGGLGEGKEYILVILVCI